MEDVEPLKASGGVLRYTPSHPPIFQGEGWRPREGRGCSESPDGDLTTSGMLSAPLPCMARGTEACVSAGEVPLLQRSQAQSQAAWEVPAVLRVGQAQVGSGLPGFSLSALSEGDQAPCLPCHPVSQGSVSSRC